MLTLCLFVEHDQVLESAAIGAAFGVPDDGQTGFEIGRAETGAALFLERGADGLWLARIPTVRAPWSAGDLLPSLVAAADALGGIFAPEGPRPEAAPSLQEVWAEAHARDVDTLVQTCASSGAPLPPFAPRALLDRVHATLLDVADDAPPAHPRHVYALDAADGSPTRFATRLPAEADHFWVPVLDGVLFDPDGGAASMERPAYYPLADLLEVGERSGDRLLLERDAAIAALKSGFGEPLARLRIITPVEVLDEESFPAV